MQKSIIIPKTIDFINLSTPEIEKKAITDIKLYIKKMNSRKELKRPTKLNIPKLDLSVLQN